MKPAKITDQIEHRITELESILDHAIRRNDTRIAKIVKSDILKFKAGYSAEKTAAHLLDKFFHESQRTILLHDLRLEIDGDVAQIDHLAINRFGFVRLFETKSFSTGIKIDEDGTFWRWDAYAKSYVEIPSPILQSQRHEVTLRKALKASGYDALQFLHYVLIDYKAKLIKPKNGQFDNVCRPDRLEEVWKKEDDQPVKVAELGLALKGLGRLFTGKSLTIEELQDIGNKIAAMHTPLKTNYWARYGLVKPTCDSVSFSGGADTITEAPHPLISIQIDNQNESRKPEQLSSSKAARKLKLTTEEFLKIAEQAGLVKKENDSFVATLKAENLGVTNKVFRNIQYISWPVAIIDGIGDSLNKGEDPKSIFQ